ncbi:uncharacterized protein LOC119360316 [Triticum dicoccoides]|uniref:uncharacterized protein LOC119360316 n=1 Tax=Triticum dicoccoides TaxID=85692 RepID=UPI00188DC6C9|nr:uncharacterized protein LOC119360316 [Triticum dicoccoides]
MARYSIDVLRISANRYPEGVANGADLIILGGNPLFLQHFQFDWVDYGLANLRSNLLPRICAHTLPIVRVLIQLERENPGYYRTRPEGYMEQRMWRWHPLMEAMAHLLFAPSAMNNGGGVDNGNAGASSSDRNQEEASRNESELGKCVDDRRFR